MENQVNQKPKRAERPDKAIFHGMVSVFFIFFSLPAFYWAFYNYGEYNRTTTFVQELRADNKNFRICVKFVFKQSAGN